jgi:hypothetical protein
MCAQEKIVCNMYMQKKNVATVQVCTRQQADMLWRSAWARATQEVLQMLGAERTGT